MVEIVVGGFVFMAALTLPLKAEGSALAADLIIFGGTIYTMEEDQPKVEAVAVRGDRIAYTGSVAGADEWKGPATRTMDLKGATMLPGLIDAHGHLQSLGRSLAQLSLRGTKSPEQIRTMVIEREKTMAPGAWISGRGWDQNDWAKTEFPSWRDLAGTEAHPVLLRRVDGHAAWLNKTALDFCGITKETPDPPGGRILRDEKGNPTGVLIDNAADLAMKRVPQPSREERLEWMEAAIQECHRYGLTGIHDAGVDAATLDLYRQLRIKDKLTLRAYLMLSDEDSSFLAERLKNGPETSDPFLTVRAVKLYADGALGSRGAALLEPYSDDPENRGLLVNQPEYIERTTVEALKNGFQVCTHAIGDRGNRVTLDAYQKALSQVSSGDYRLRLEHAQVVSPQDAPRFTELSIIASMQPTHATSDMSWAINRLGSERIEGAYAWRTLLNSGCRLAFGSDFPIEAPDPIAGIYAAVTRQDAEGCPEGGWQPQERLSVREAVRGFTSGAAWAGFQEASVGSIKVGKLADFTVLDRDILAVPPSEIGKITVLYTLVGGRVIYHKTP